MSEKRNFGEAEEWFHQKATDYVVAQAMFHLNQEGVLSALNMSRTSVSAEELAAERNLDSDKLATLLLYLASVDRVFTHEPPDRFALTSFGRTVVQRYGKTTESGLLVNMFDVRVGAYGPVWNSIGDLVSGRSTYGEEVQREGRFSERGLYATARGMGPSLLEALDDQSGPVVEMGVETGLLEHVGRHRPDLELWALDRSERAIAKCTELARQQGVDGIHPLQADLFRVESWADRLQNGGPGVFFTIHLHEFMAAGRERMVGLVGSIQERFKGWKWVFFEQSRPGFSRPPKTSEANWRASQSNILIHHFIKNGRILTEDEWREIIHDGGSVVDSVEESGYLDYKRYIVQL